MVLDGLTGNSLDDIAPGRHRRSGLLETSPDRMTLFEQELGGSPSDVHKYELSGSGGEWIWSQETGSNGQDLAVSHDGLFFAAPNGAPYNIKLLRSSDGAVLGTLNTGAYPREIAFSPDDLYAYVVHTRGEIDVFRTDTFLPDGPVSILGEASELLVDGSGQYLFASVDDELRVYATGVVPEPSSLVLGSLGAMALFFVAYFRPIRRRNRRADRLSSGTG